MEGGHPPRALTGLVLPELGGVRVEGALDVRLWGQGLGQQAGWPGPLSPATQLCRGGVAPSPPPQHPTVVWPWDPPASRLWMESRMVRTS